MKQYAIREINFSYDDHFSYHPDKPDGNIVAKYDNYESALQALRKFEISAMRQQEPSLFFFLHGYDSYEPTKNKMTLFFENEFNQPIQNWRDEQYYLPNSATDNQVVECKEILRVDFYKLTELDTPDVFFKPIVNPAFWDTLRYELAKDAMFEIEWKGYMYYISMEEAIANAPKFLRYWVFDHSENTNTPGFTGTLDELSNEPIQLKAFLDTSQDFQFNSLLNRIEVKDIWGVDRDIGALATLVDLLIVKPYLVQTITSDEAKKLEYWFRNADGTFWYPDSHH